MDAPIPVKLLPQLWLLTKLLKLLQFSPETDVEIILRKRKPDVTRNRKWMLV